MVIATSHLLDLQFDKKRAPVSGPSMTQQKIFGMCFEKGANFKASIKRLTTLQLDKRGHFHHTRRDLTLSRPRQEQSISTNHTLVSRGYCLKEHSEKSLGSRQLRVTSRLLTFALPRLPSKNSMLLLIQEMKSSNLHNENRSRYQKYDIIVIRMIK